MISRLVFAIALVFSASASACKLSQLGASHYVIKAVNAKLVERLPQDAWIRSIKTDSISAEVEAVVNGQCEHILYIYSVDASCNIKLEEEEKSAIRCE